MYALLSSHAEVLLERFIKALMFERVDLFNFFSPLFSV